MATQQAQAMSAAQANAIARNAVIKNAVPMEQPLPAVTVVPANQNVVSVQPRTVGLIRSFRVHVTATVTNTAAAALTLTDFGPMNLFSNISFTDLNNNQRINTPLWHIFMVDSMKKRTPFGLSGSLNESVVKFGNNWAPQAAPATIATSGTGTIQFWFDIPIAYSDYDLRGGIYANVLNAQMQLVFSINQNAFVASNSVDTTNAIYYGNAAASISSMTIQVYQRYFDQIPVANGQPLLPVLDLNTMYELKYTNYANAVANVDFPIPYPNFRDFISTFVVYNNNGTTGRATGADINYWSLVSANATNIFKKDPVAVALSARQILTTDCPPGMYYFDSRQRPISTSQFGNMALNLNAVTANTGNYALVAFEDFAMLNSISQASSLNIS